MATCANCANDALYTYHVTDSFTIPYCQKHVPRFLESHRHSGSLREVDSFQAQAEATIAQIATVPVVEEPLVEPTKTSKKKTAPVVEEPAPTE